MAVKKVSVIINGSRVELTKIQLLARYEGTIAAPNITSFNVNTDHYYPVSVEAEDLAGNITTGTDSYATLGKTLYIESIL